MFYFMTLSFIIMPALGCFLIGLAFAKPDRWDLFLDFILNRFGGLYFFFLAYSTCRFMVYAKL